MCTDRVLHVKKLLRELNAREWHQVFNSMLWDATRANNTHYKYINNYIKYNSVSFNAHADTRGKHSNVVIPDDDYKQFVAEFGQEFTDKVIDQLSDKIKAGYMSKDHAVTFRVFAEAQQRFDVRHAPVPNHKKEYIRHNYSPDVFRARSNDEIEF